MFFKRSVALPQDHGAWVFLLSPLLIGISIGGSINVGTGLVVLSCLNAFLLRQPIIVGIKIRSGRRSGRDLPAVRFWLVIYASIAIILSLGLVYTGLSHLFLLALLGVVVFIWHLVLISRRAERRQIGFEIVGSGVLALAAPAAFWTATGKPSTLGWWLWGLTWLQSAASIVYAYLRLNQRSLESIPDLRGRIRTGRRAWLYSSFNLFFVTALAVLDVLPHLLPLAYVIQWLESIWGTLKPAVRLRPTTIGLRQLWISTFYTAVFILTWYLG